MTRAASCQCGSLRVITSGTPANSYLCHLLRVRGALALLFIPAPIITRINCDLRERAKSTLASLIQALKFVFIFVPIAAPQFIGRQINILINVGSPWAALPTRNFLRRRAPYGGKQA